ncbi:unnamed protein product [Paramecium sonneborni]|uniref:Uncharacterized protein n=1 Tax=Paramecium sonneborni TaxID=65129 RepID=A0A8S1PVK4_9CILI|nr:unnamed protein product [Paramecium sonneborni]
MSKKHLVEEMIIIREEMRNINNRIQTTNSTKIFEFTPHQNKNQKIRKYCYQLIALKPKLFIKYFISEQYIHELLKKMDYEKLLQISLKFIVKYLQCQENSEIQQNHSNSPNNIKDVQKVNKIIRDIVSPIKTKIISQSQFFDNQLKNINKSCQTLPQNQESQSKNNFNLGIRQQSSILSSIQQDNINSPKFNENIINAINEISFERSSIKKDNQNMKQIDQQFDNQNQKLNHSQINNYKQMDQDISVITTPKQKEFENYKQTLNTSMNSSFKDTKRKFQNKSLLELKNLEKLDDKRFPKKEIPYTMLSVDYVRKRRKTPEKNRGFNIITNY